MILYLWMLQYCSMNLPYKTIERDWSQNETGFNMFFKLQKVSFPVVSTRILSHIPLSLTKLPSNTWWGWLAPHLYGMRFDNHLMHFMKSQLCVFLMIFILHYYCWYFISYLNQTDILHWQWILMSMTVLLPINYRYWDTTVIHHHVMGKGPLGFLFLIKFLNILSVVMLCNIL